MQARAVGASQTSVMIAPDSTSLTGVENVTAGATPGTGSLSSEQPVSTREISVAQTNTEVNCRRSSKAFMWYPSTSVNQSTSVGTERAENLGETNDRTGPEQA